MWLSTARAGTQYRKNGAVLFRHYQVTDVGIQHFLGSCIIHSIPNFSHISAQPLRRYELSKFVLCSLYFSSSFHTLKKKLEGSMNILMHTYNPIFAEMDENRRNMSNFQKLKV